MAMAKKVKMTDHTKTPKLQHFRQILFWPLRLIPPDQDKTNWERNGCTTDIQKFLVDTSPSPWMPLNENLCNRDIAPSEITCYAEFVYFHPFIRNFLYGDPSLKSPMLRLFKRTDVEKLHIVLREGQELEFDVDRIHLYIFDIGIAILVMEISSTNLENTELSVIQDFLDQFRRVYPPYWDESDKGNYKAGRCPQTVTFLGKKDQVLIKGTYNAPKEFFPFVRQKVSPITKHWCFLLEPFVPYECSQWDSDKIRYQQLQDERMPYMAYLAFDNPRLLTKGDMMRLGFADGSGNRNSLPSSSNSKFSQNFERDYCYDDYWETDLLQYHDKHSWMNTRYICCGYAFTMIGEFYEDEKGPGFFNNNKVGALAHFRHHYFQIGLIVHFHKAGLLVLWDNLYKKTDFSNSSGSQHLNEIHEVREILQKLQQLTKLFSEVSTLGQAKELFNLWEHHLGIKDSLERALKETQDIHDRLEIEAQKQQTDTTVLLTVVATVGLTVALTLGFFGGNLQEIEIWGGDDDSPTLKSLLTVFSGFVFGVSVTLFFSQQLSRVIDWVTTKKMWQWLKNKFKGN
jgi:hypothetical protein